MLARRLLDSQVLDHQAEPSSHAYCPIGPHRSVPGDEPASRLSKTKQHNLRHILPVFLPNGKTIVMGAGWGLTKMMQTCTGAHSTVFPPILPRDPGIWQTCYKMAVAPLWEKQACPFKHLADAPWYCLSPSLLPAAVEAPIRNLSRQNCATIARGTAAAVCMKAHTSRTSGTTQNERPNA